MAKIVRKNMKKQRYVYSWLMKIIIILDIGKLIIGTSLSIFEDLIAPLRMPRAAIIFTNACMLAYIILATFSQ